MRAAQFVSLFGARKAVLGAFDAAPFFALGQQGAVYDDADLSTMFTDVGGTVQARRVGDAIAFQRDKSGNGHHRSQSTLAARPLLAKDANGNWCLDWRTNRWMSCANFDLSASDKLTFVTAIAKLASAGGIVMELSASAAANNGSFLFLTRAGAATDSVSVKGTNAVMTAVTTNQGEPFTYVTTCQIDLNASSNVLSARSRINGVDAIPVPGTISNGGNFGASYTMYFGTRAGGATFPFNGLTYGTVIRGGPMLLSEMQSLEQPLGLKCGRSLAGPVSVPGLPAGTPYQLVISYGQSLSVGILSTPLQNEVPRYDTVSFSGGVRPLDNTTDPSVAYASLIPLIERTSGTNTTAAYGANTANETPVFAWCATVNELLASEGGTGGFYKMMGLATGIGATSLFNLGRGTPGYVRMLDEIRYARRLAAADGRPLTVPAVSWMQGESDGAVTTAYRPALEDFYADLVADIKDATGQSADPLLLSYQTPGSFAVGIQQWQASLEIAGIHMAGPIYQLPRTGLHLLGPGSEHYGAYIAKAHKRLVVDATAWLPLSPVSVSYASGNIDIVLHGNVGQVVLDTTTIALQTQSGFTLLDAGASNVVINSVSVIGTNTIRLATSATIAAGFTITYANTQAAGNVRDSDATVYAPTGDNYPLYNWLVAFQWVTV